MRDQISYSFACSTEESAQAKVNRCLAVEGLTPTATKIFASARACFFVMRLKQNLQHKDCEYENGNYALASIEKLRKIDIDCVLVTAT
jgi:hypothetical protein